MSKKNSHGCLYYIFVWPVVLIFKLIFYAVIFGFTFIGCIFKCIYRILFRKYPKNYSDMSGLEFEEYAAEVLRKKGFKSVKVTQGSGDQGIDIFAKMHGETYAIQVKNYQNPVGNKAVQEAYAGCTFYGCDIPVVLTNSTFTPSAKELAEKTGVLLWNIEHI